MLYRLPPKEKKTVEALMSFMQELDAQLAGQDNVWHFPHFQSDWAIPLAAGGQFAWAEQCMDKDKGILFFAERMAGTALASEEPELALQWARRCLDAIEPRWEMSEPDSYGQSRILDAVISVARVCHLAGDEAASGKALDFFQKNYHDYLGGLSKFHVIRKLFEMGQAELGRRLLLETAPLVRGLSEGTAFEYLLRRLVRMGLHLEVWATVGMDGRVHGFENLELSAIPWAMNAAVIEGELELGLKLASLVKEEPRILARFAEVMVEKCGFPFFWKAWEEFSQNFRYHVGGEGLAAMLAEVAPHCGEVEMARLRELAVDYLDKDIHYPNQTYSLSPMAHQMVLCAYLGEERTARDLLERHPGPEPLQQWWRAVWPAERNRWDFLLEAIRERMFVDDLQIRKAITRTELLRAKRGLPNSAQESLNEYLVQAKFMEVEEREAALQIQMLCAAEVEPLRIVEIMELRGMNNRLSDLHLESVGTRALMAGDLQLALRAWRMIEHPGELFGNLLRITQKYLISRHPILSIPEFPNAVSNWE